MKMTREVQGRHEAGFGVVLESISIERDTTRCEESKAWLHT